jgi:hypothetical protein
VKNLINGKFVESATKEWIPLYNPVRSGPGLPRQAQRPEHSNFSVPLTLRPLSAQANNELVCHVPQSTQSEVRSTRAAWWAQWTLLVCDRVVCK